MGSLVAFVLLQNVLGMDAVAPVEAGAYVSQLARITAAGLVAGGDSG